MAAQPLSEELKRQAIEAVERYGTITAAGFGYLAGKGLIDGETATVQKMIGRKP